MHQHISFDQPNHAVTMQDPKYNPYVLFNRNTFLQSQEQFGDLIVAEVKQLYDNPDTSINLNNVQPFNSLLTHWETSLKSDLEVEVAYTSLRLPSTDVLRIILTLAARCTGTNWTHISVSVEGVAATNSYAKAMNQAYNNTLYKTSFQSRSLLLLENYRDILVTHIRRSPSITDPSVDVLYRKLNTILSDFIVLLWPIAKSVLLEVPIIKIKKSEKTSPKTQSKITNFFQKSISAVSHEQDIDDYVSDSENDLTMLKNPMTMEQELEKYKYNLKSTSFNSDVFGLLNGDDSEPPQKKHKSKQKNLQSGDEDLPIWAKISIFDEPMLSYKLNPRLNSKTSSSFNLWLLINWAFHCAEMSSNLQEARPNSSFSAYHNIFQTHNDLIIVIFDLIEVNFFTTFNRHKIIQDNISKQSRLQDSSDILKAYFNTPSKFRTLILYHMEDSAFQVYALLAQLSNRQIDWYDRLVEYVFNGLGLKSYSNPVSCYEREVLLIKRDESKNEKFNMEEFVPEVFTDDLTSMLTRFKITVFVFYRALFFSNGDLLGMISTTPVTHMRPAGLLVELSQKFSAIAFKYLREFYYSEKIIGNRTLVPKKYQITMLLELAQVLILEITDVVEHQNFSIRRFEEQEIIDAVAEDSFDDITLTSMSESEDGDDIVITGSQNLRVDKEAEKLVKPTWQIANVNRLLDTINDVDTYTPLIENEVYKGFEDFKESWLKVIFLLEWMLYLVLQDYEEYAATDTAMLKKVTESSLSADHVRADSFEKFINAGSKPSSSFAFELSSQNVQEIRDATAELCGYHAIVRQVLS